MNTQRFLFLALLWPLLLLGSSGCGSSDQYVFTRSANPNLPPLANPDSYPSVGNAPLTIPAAAGLFANDQLNGGGLASFDSSGTEGGSVQVEEDGSFTYTPLFGFTGTDSFTYTISNDQGESSTTVTINIANLAFFVDNTAADGGNGSFDSRFNTMAQATAAAGPNDFIAVFRGNGTNQGLAGPIQLQDGQKLIGEGAGFTADSSLLQRSDEVRSQAIIPAGEPAVITGPVMLADGNLVAGFRIEGSDSDAIFGEAINDATIENNEILGYAQSGIEFLNSTGTLQVLRCTIHPVGTIQDGILLNNTNASATVVINENTFAGGVRGLHCAYIVLEDPLSTINLTCNNNRVLSDGDNWDYGFNFLCNGVGTFRADGNEFFGNGLPGLLASALDEGELEIALTSNDLIGGRGIGVHATAQSQINGEIRGNTVNMDGINGRGISLEGSNFGGMDLSIMENMLTGPNTGNDNTFDTSVQCGIGIGLQSLATCNALIEGNVIQGFRHGIWYHTSENRPSELSIINNNISGAEFNGLLISVPNPMSIGHQLQAEISMNNVTKNGANGIEVVAGLAGKIKAAVQGNNATGNTGTDIRLATEESAAYLCAAIRDNTCGDLVLFNNGHTFKVESLLDLEILNTITTLTKTGTLTAIDPDDCLTEPFPGP